MDTAALDRSIQILEAHKDQWARLPVLAKRQYLPRIVEKQIAVARRQVDAAIKAKGVPAGTLEAEDWANGPYCTVRFARLLMRSLQEIAARGVPVINPGAMRTRPDGQLLVRVFPATLADKLIFRGFRAEVWMQAGVNRKNLSDHMACFHRQKTPAGKVALVLGAGNVASIGPLDVLTKLYGEGQVCLLKLNPVNEYLGPFIEESFAELIKDGYVRIAYGGADAGEYLCNHPGIDEVHITGSDATHDAIVFGSGDEGRRRKHDKNPRFHKRITSELGNVSPVIVVPGPWSAADLKFHATNIATQMINNCGFNCCAARVLVLPKAWPLSAALMAELRAVLSAAPQRKSYYPGAEERYRRFVSANVSAQPLGEGRPGILPWTVIPDLEPDDSSNVCYTSEAFCGVIAQTALPGADPADFLRRAIDFCNQRLWGTLSACILVHPEVERSLGESLEDQIAALKYGTVGVNHWPVLGFAWGSTTWGAFPGHTFENIQSGIGVVHNAMLFDRPERTVIYGPFTVRPKPAWFIDSRVARKVFPALVDLEAHPGVWNLLRVITAAVAG